MNLYTTEQRKAFVRSALAWLERYEREQHARGRPAVATALMYRERIAYFTPNGRDPLDWSTEP